MVLFAIPVSKDAAVSKLALVTNQKRAFTSASSDHIFGIILYPLHVKSKMWSEALSQGLLPAPTFFTLPPTLAAKSLNHDSLKYY
jgi:hypothetical protein